MRMIHNGGENPFRMPLFLPKELEFKWLDPNLPDNDLKNIIDYEMPSEELSYYTVASVRSQKGRPDGKKKNEPFEFKNLPPLGNDDGTIKVQAELF